MKGVNLFPHVLYLTILCGAKSPTRLEGELKVTLIINARMIVLIYYKFNYTIKIQGFTSKLLKMTPHNDSNVIKYAD